MNAIKSILTIVFLVTITFSEAQTRQFVCTPCGSDCDTRVYDRAGTCSSCGMALVEKSSANVINLTLAEMCARIAANPDIVLLDVRSPGEFNDSAFGNTYGHFKNAININIDDLEGRIGELSKYKEDEVIVYCSHSHRSPRAAYILTTRGFKDVKNMSGGVSTFGGKKKDECLKSNFVFH